MTARTRPTTTTNGDPRQQILGVLRARLGAARTAELAHATGLTEVEVIDALCDLERDGLVTPPCGGSPTTASIMSDRPWSTTIVARRI